MNCLHWILARAIVSESLKCSQVKVTLFSMGLVASCEWTEGLGKIFLSLSGLLLTGSASLTVLIAVARPADDGFVCRRLWCRQCYSSQQTVRTGWTVIEVAQPFSVLGKETIFFRMTENEKISFFWALKPISASLNWGCSEHRCSLLSCVHSVTLFCYLKIFIIIPLIIDLDFVF